MLLVGVLQHSAVTRAPVSPCVTLNIHVYWFCQPSCPKMFNVCHLLSEIVEPTQRSTLAMYACHTVVHLGLGAGVCVLLIKTLKLGCMS